MQDAAFDTLRTLEDSWWHQGRIYAVREAMKNVCGKEDVAGPVLDVGAGYGGMVSLLQSFGDVDAVEPHVEARNACLKRGYKHTYATIQDVRGAEGYKVVGAFDVVEHVEDDAQFVRDMFVHVQPGGYTLVTVPAFQFLWSKHDELHNHYRRYTTRQLKKVLVKAGFTVRYCKYWNTTLFLPAAAMRLLNMTGDSTLSKDSRLHGLFLSIVQAESKILPLLPSLFGTGIVAVAQKNVNN